MPTFSKAEIREFLIEQGFDVSDEETLEVFIRDFKKLIKYEQMKKRRTKLGHLPNETVLDSTDGGNYGQTTTSTTQDSTSYEEAPLEDTENNRSRPHHKFKDRSSSRTPLTENKYPVKGHSPSKKEEHSRRTVGSVAGSRSPRHQYTHQVDGDTGRTKTFGTDASHPPDSRYSDSGYREVKRLTPLKQYDDRNKVPSSSAVSKATAPPKKRGNKLMMHRVTASQNPNGTPVVNTEDIDIAKGKRPVWNVNSWRPSTAHNRPQTAPNPVRPRSQLSERRPSNPVPQRPTSARSQPSKINGNKIRDDVYDESEPEPDELFHALNELIFPNDRADSDDESSERSNGTKPLLKPPPHVAIDPVALYHWYKTYNWDVYSIPGEDRHMKLRWNVRAKTVGGYHPCTEVRSNYKPSTAKRSELRLNNPQLPICR